MRRSMLVPAVMTVVLCAAVPATTQVQLPGTDATQVQVSGTTTDSSLTSTTNSLVGQLVDSACYLARGNKAMGQDHMKCAIACAQKGQRLALVTDKGDVFMVTGVLTQDNNVKLIPLLGRMIVLTGTVSQVTVQTTPVPTVVSQGDGRRPSGTEDGVVTTKVRKGDFQEGDVQDGVEMVIDAVSVDVAPIGIQ